MGMNAIATPLPQEQKVRIIAGPFNTFIGTLEQDDELDTTVTVVLSLFGRPIRTQVKREQIVSL